MRIITRALIGATLALALITPVTAQPVPSGEIAAATIKAGSRYDVALFYEGKWHDVKENVAAANPRQAVSNAFAGGYASMPYQHVSRAYFVKQPFTGIRAYDIRSRKSTFHCNLQFRTINGCRN